MYELHMCPVLAECRRGRQVSWTWGYSVLYMGAENWAHWTSSVAPFDRLFQAGYFLCKYIFTNRITDHSFHRFEMHVSVMENSHALFLHPLVFILSFLSFTVSSAIFSFKTSLCRCQNGFERWSLATRSSFPLLVTSPVNCTVLIALGQGRTWAGAKEAVRNKGKMGGSDGKEEWKKYSFKFSKNSCCNFTKLLWSFIGSPLSEAVALNGCWGREGENGLGFSGAVELHMYY